MNRDKVRSLLEEALNRGKVYLHVNPSVEGVSLPASLMGRDRVPLVVAWGAPGIELDLGDEVIAATLRFSGEPFRCVIPWPSLLAIISAHPEPAPARPQKSPRLEVVEGGSDERKEKREGRPRLKLLDD